MATETPSEKRKTGAQQYWTQNIRLLLILLTIWFSCSFGAGILFVDSLNKIVIGGFPLSFWFAQQGSIYIFVALIFFYTFRMQTIERQHASRDRATDQCS